jgi:hypothetical protein
MPYQNSKQFLYPNQLLSYFKEYNIKLDLSKQVLLYFNDPN